MLYTIERGYLGKTETYNDIANWSYADLPKVFHRDTRVRYRWLRAPDLDLFSGLACIGAVFGSGCQPPQPIAIITRTLRDLISFSKTSAGGKRRAGVQARWLGAD
jgi:indolepyruvate decarboxylase